MIAKKTGQHEQGNQHAIRRNVRPEESSPKNPWSTRERSPQDSFSKKQKLHAHSRQEKMEHLHADDRFRPLPEEGHRGKFGNKHPVQYEDGDSGEQSEYVGLAH